jgi:hypothetical protein
MCVAALIDEVKNLIDSCVVSFAKSLFESEITIEGKISYAAHAR